MIWIMGEYEESDAAGVKRDQFLLAPTKHDMVKVMGTKDKNFVKVSCPLYMFRDVEKSFKAEPAPVKLSQGKIH